MGYFELVEANPPYIELDQMDACRRIIDANADIFPGFLEEYEMSAMLEFFVDGLLTYEPTERPDTTELLKDPYIKKTVDDLEKLHRMRYFDTSDNASENVGFGKNQHFQMHSHW